MFIWTGCTSKEGIYWRISKAPHYIAQGAKSLQKDSGNVNLSIGKFVITKVYERAERRMLILKDRNSKVKIKRLIKL